MDMGKKKQQLNMNWNSITNGHIWRCYTAWTIDSCRVTMATLPIQWQRWQEIPVNGKQLLLVPLNNSYPMNYLNQNYHKLFNLCSTQRDNTTHPDVIIVQARSKAQYTSQWKTTPTEEVFSILWLPNSIYKHFKLILLFSHHKPISKSKIK